MAKRDCKSESFISQALRRSVVGYAPDAYRYPQVKLKGKWLEQAGFLTGTPLAVRVMDGCLVITTQPSALLNEVLQQADRLSARPGHGASWSKWYRGWCLGSSYLGEVWANKGKQRGNPGRITGVIS